MRIAVLLLLVSFGSQAQIDQKVMEPIHQLFEGMKKGDSTLVHNAFHPYAKLYTVFMDTKTQQPVLRGDVFSAFLQAIGTPHSMVWNELIWSTKIEIDGNFAQVWASYAFYTDKKFSHCGVDAFHLFKNAGGQWKIFHLADTRQTEGCTVPKEVSDQLK
jgi:hypothetical protein